MEVIQCKNCDKSSKQYTKYTLREKTIDDVMRDCGVKLQVTRKKHE